MSNLHLRYPDWRYKALTLSYDDGVEQDVKLLEIMRKYGLKGTFNLNSGVYPSEDNVWPEGQVHRRMTEKMVSETYVGDDIEVAVHGYTHPFWEQLSPCCTTYDIIQDRRTLENQFGRMVRGAAYPYGTYNDKVVEILGNCGICYCRTVNSSHDFYLPSNWLTLFPTCHHDDPQLFDLAQQFIDRPEEHSALMFYLWGHAYEFEANNNWDRIEKFAQMMGGRDDIWYATNIEIYDYVKAFDQLIFNVDMTKCYNPTQTDIWFEAHPFSYLNGSKYVVRAGETIDL